MDFDAAIAGPQWSDADGFDAIKYFSTFRLADINADGRSDACIRTKAGFECAHSNGSGFDAPVVGPAWSDAKGWGNPEYFSTIRMGDVDGDGRADVCARAAAGIRCHRSNGAGFDDATSGPAWSDASGWAAFEYYSTIRLVDLDNDGRADLCGRNADGIECVLSVPEGFGEPILGPAISDAKGWSDASNFSTVRFADIDGDGRMDLCARANDGLRCWKFDGERFDEQAIVGPMKDDDSWASPDMYRTLQFADVDADGRADACGRSKSGWKCWRSLGDAFEATPIEGPAWTDANGFDAADKYSTARLLGSTRARFDDEGGRLPVDSPETTANTPMNPTGNAPMVDSTSAVATESGCQSASGSFGSLWFLGLVVVLRRKKRRQKRD